MKSTEIRKLWKEFWETKAPIERKHAWSVPASLIVNNAEDPTTMFNTAGMQPLVPYLMGKEHPSGKRVYNIQGCIRTGDIEEVGDASHLTYFEMMGNRSLGDYFKKEAIAWSREFLTDWLKLDPNKIAVTVFEGDKDAPRDEESAELWKGQGVPAERIAYLGKKDNWWGPAGQTGPCGPDTEIFYRIGDTEFPPAGNTPGTDEDSWLEIWNNVFMAYYKDTDGNFSELEAKNVDTGMGFERISLVKQCQEGVIETPLKDASVYETDIFSGILKTIKTHVSETRRARIIADHVRTSFWLLYEGLIPSNEGRGYVLRRLIRRMYFQWYMGNDRSSFQSHREIFEKVLYVIKEELNRVYEGVFTNAIIEQILSEVEKFASTIHHGEKLLQEILEDQTGKILAGDDVFKLYDTHGFPVELTEEIVQEQGGSIDREGFEKAMEAAQERSRQGSKEMFAKNVDWSSYIDGVEPTEFIGYDEVEVEGVQLLKDFTVDGQRVLIFDKTPFYAEGGGQTGDSGTIFLDSGEFVHVHDVQKFGGVRLHFVQ